MLRAGVVAAMSALLAACAGRLSAATPDVRPSPSRATSPSPSPSPPLTPGPSASPTSGLALRAKVAGLLIVGFRGLTLDAAPWVGAALRDEGLGGVILFDRDQQSGSGRNIDSPTQVTALVRELHAAGAGRPVIVAIDQEGGVVTRLSPAHGFPAVASQADVGSGTADAARAWANGLATTLAAVGIDLNFAPVVDLDVNPDNPAIGRLDRSFSADPEVVVAMATIEVEAHRAAGVLTTLKHFPGIGSAGVNTDFGVADVTATWHRIELEPYARLIAAGAADAIMSGHVVNGQIDPDRPASLSPATVSDVLRDELGWDGVVVTDDLQAAAIDAEFGLEEAVVLALEAGNDLLLLANQQVYDDRLVTRAADTVETAVASGRLPVARIDQAYDRVQAMLAGRHGRR